VQPALDQPRRYTMGPPQERRMRPLRAQNRLPGKLAPVRLPYPRARRDLAPPFGQVKSVPATPTIDRNGTCAAACGPAPLPRNLSRPAAEPAAVAGGASGSDGWRPVVLLQWKPGRDAPPIADLRCLVPLPSPGCHGCAAGWRRCDTGPRTVPLFGRARQSAPAAYGTGRVLASRFRSVFGVPIPNTHSLPRRGHRQDRL